MNPALTFSKKSRLRDSNFPSFSRLLALISLCLALLRATSGSISIKKEIRYLKTVRSLKNP